MGVAVAVALGVLVLFLGFVAICACVVGSVADYQRQNDGRNP